MTKLAEASTVGARTRVPDFFIVGHQKSGTTALHEMLKRHPQIYMPDFKEPTFFAADLRACIKQRIPEPETLAEYLPLFEPARPEQLVGEASSLYLWSRQAADAIADVQPQARIIAILREPASFLHSLHLQNVKEHLESEKRLRDALALEPARREGERIPRGCYRPQALLYSERVRYVEQLQRFRARFPGEQVLVLIYDDFRADNERTVREVLRFLGAEEDWQVPSVEVNYSVAVRSQRLDRLRHELRWGSHPLTRALRGAGLSLTSERSRRLLSRGVRGALYHQAPAPDPQLALELRRRFRAEVLALSDYLGRDLVSLWGYDTVR